MKKEKAAEVRIKEVKQLIAALMEKAKSEIKEKAANDKRNKTCKP